MRDDLETLVLDADVLDAVLGTTDPEKKSKEIEIKVAERLRRHLHDPRIRALGERLEELRRKHEQGLLASIEFLKSLLELARDVVEAERTVEPATPEEHGKAALTELFEEARNDRTPVMVKRIVDDIDEIVRHVRFEGWQTTHAGEREVKRRSGRRCSSTACTRTRICSTGPTATSGSTTDSRPRTRQPEGAERPHCDARGVGPSLHHSQPAVEGVEFRLDAGLPERGHVEGAGAPDTHRRRPERHRLEHVPTATGAAVDDDQGVPRPPAAPPGVHSTAERRLCSMRSPWVRAPIPSAPYSSDTSASPRVTIPLSITFVDVPFSSRLT